MYINFYGDYKVSVKLAIILAYLSRDDLVNYLVTS